MIELLIADLANDAFGPLPQQTIEQNIRVLELGLIQQRDEIAALRAALETAERERDEARVDVEHERNTSACLLSVERSAYDRCKADFDEMAARAESLARVARAAVDGRDIAVAQWERISPLVEAIGQWVRFRHNKTLLDAWERYQQSKAQ